MLRTLTPARTLAAAGAGSREKSVPARKPSAGTFLAASVAAHLVLAAVVYLVGVRPETAGRNVPRYVVIDLERQSAARPVKTPVPAEPRPTAAVVPVKNDAAPKIARATRRLAELSPLRPANERASVALAPVFSTERPRDTVDGVMGAVTEPENMEFAPPVQPATAAGSNPQRRYAPASRNRKKDWAAVAATMRQAIRKHLRYPESARRQGIEGVVVLRFRVQQSGRAHPVRIRKSAGAALDRAAIQAVRNAQPLPAYPDWVQIPLRFSLDD